MPEVKTKQYQQLDLQFADVAQEEPRNYGREIRTILDYQQKSFELIFESLRKSFGKSNS